MEVTNTAEEAEERGPFLLKAGESSVQSAAAKNMTFVRFLFFFFLPLSKEKRLISGV